MRRLREVLVAAANSSFRATASIAAERSRCLRGGDGGGESGAAAASEGGSGAERTAVRARRAPSVPRWCCFSTFALYADTAAKNPGAELGTQPSLLAAYVTEEM